MEKRNDKNGVAGSWEEGAALFEAWLLCERIRERDAASQGGAKTPGCENEERGLKGLVRGKNGAKK